MAELQITSGFTELTPETLRSPEGVLMLNNMLRVLFDKYAGDTESVRILHGYGTPEENVSSGIGSLYMRVDGGEDTSLYVKESGTGNTGWVAK